VVVTPIETDTVGRRRLFWPGRGPTAYLLETRMAMIVTIDGPAGAGKSTTARRLASRLGFRFLDTGAMYRALTLAALEKGVDFERPDALVQLAREIKIELRGDRVLLDGRDVSREIRSSEITGLSRYAANSGPVRAILVQWQREAAKGASVVTEGRDQGTVVFPDAACKIYLTASPAERAQRRYADLAARGEAVSFEDVLDQQQQRDHRDATRATGPLTKARDAIEVVTDALSCEQVVDRLEAIVRQRLSDRNVPGERSTTNP